MNALDIYENRLERIIDIIQRFVDDMDDDEHENQALMNYLSIQIKSPLENLIRAFDQYKKNKANYTENEAIELLSEMITGLEEKFSEHANNPLFYDLIRKAKAVLHVNVTPPSSLFANKIPWQEVNIIGCRGDTRSPESVFKEGFQPKDKSDEASGIRERFISGQGVVPFSSRFLSAAIFPPDPNIEKTWVYIFKADKVFNVNTHGFHHYQNLIVENPKNLDLMFAQELVTTNVNPEQIIACVEIDRYSRKNLERMKQGDEKRFYEARGQYKIISYQLNPITSASSEEVSRIEKFINYEIKINQTEHNLPLPESGYSKNMFFKAQRKSMTKDTKMMRKKVKEKKKQISKHKSEKSELNKGR